VSVPTGGQRSPGRLRIIGGHWKRTPIPVPELPGLRPTPDRVRETLFNWLGQDLSGWRVLDLFAGSGALGLEAASRGAAQVIMIEREPAAFRSIQSVCRKLQADQILLVQGQAQEWLARRAPGEPAFDLILIDPPFGGTALQSILPAAWASLAPTGALYVEWGQPLRSDQPPLAGLVDLQVFRTGQAGQVHYHLLRRAV
jgi:16S rRNA (guanine966-N2)-methyltransferase